MSALSDPRSMLPVQLPPERVVGEKAAQAIRAFNALDESLPPRRDSDQLNRLDAARTKAVVQVGVDLAALDDQEEELLGALRCDIAQLQSHWRRLEEIRGLREWRSRGMGQYRPASIGVMSVMLGSGVTKIVTGREVIAGLSSTIGGG